MNRFHPSIAVFVFALVDAYAGQPDASLDPVAVRDGARLVVDCRAEHLPSRRAVGEVIETNNASRIEVERERLIHTAHRECMRGVPAVTFVREALASGPSLALAERSPSR